MTDPGELSAPPVFYADYTMLLKYGEKSFICNLPPVNLLGLIKAASAADQSSPEEQINIALDNCQQQISNIKPSEDVVIVASDITRYSGSEIFMPMLVERLNEVGVVDSAITIVIALGIHRQQTETEHRRIIGSLYGRVKVIDHDCDDPGKLVTVGVTTCGIEVSHQPDCCRGRSSHSDRNNRLSLLCRV